MKNRISSRLAAAVVTILLAGGAAAPLEPPPPTDEAGPRPGRESARHRVESVADGHAARNPGQRWTAHFDGRGFTVAPSAADWTWGLELRSHGREGAARAVAQPADVTVDGSRITYAWSGSLEEWYVNDRRGLEHGYTLHAPPEGEAADVERPLVLTLEVRGGLRARSIDGGRGVTFMSDSGEEFLTYTGLVVFDADGELLPARLEPAPGALRLTVDPRGARYPITIDPIAQRAYVKASNTDAVDRFGKALAVSGDTLVVGAEDEDSNSTGVNGNQGNVGGSFDAGAAYVFVRDLQTDTWSQQAYLKASNTGGGDSFGFSVAVSGDTAVVGAPGEDSGATGVDGNQSDNGSSFAGAAYVFVRDPQTGTWSQQAYFKASNTDAFDNFGISVGISGDTVVVGANGEDSGATGVNGNQSDDSVNASGAAYVFVRDPQAGSWSQQAYLKASNTDASDDFGRAVAVAGDTVVVGAKNEDSSATGVNGNQADNGASGAGAAYVFVRDPQSGAWSPQAYLKASNTDAGDAFGGAVSGSGETVVVAANLEDSGATGVNGDQTDDGASAAGAAYVFVRDPQSGSWSQQAYLKASNTDPADLFGTSVAVAGDSLVVGARKEDSAASGVNGDQTDGGAVEAGAAYLFDRDPQAGTWDQRAYLKASNTDALDGFGQSVSISGGTAAVGASDEGSSATGVNGDQSDNSAFSSGAAYVFERFDGVGECFCAGAQQGVITADQTSLSAGDGVDLAVGGLDAPVQASFAMLLVSSTDQNDLVPPGSQGSVLCLGSSGAAIGRYTQDVQALGGSSSYTLSLKNSNTGGGSYGLPNPPGGSIAAGETWHFQNWSRNGSGDARFSTGLSLTFTP